MSASDCGVFQCRHDRRRGVLLLIVLSMLTLFMMLGIAYVVTASRARDASRGFAKVISAADGSQVPVDQLLDRAALLVIRGTAAGSTAMPSALPGGSPVTFESLLEDQYGTTGILTGTTTATFQDLSPLCAVEVSGVSGSQLPSSPVQLTGRILTLLPANGKPSSHRILRATATATQGSTSSAGYRIWIANVGTAFSKKQDQKRVGQGTPPSDYNFPPAGTRLVINGRERSGIGAGATNEAWDGHDFAANSFLAQVEPTPATPSTSRVVRASMIDMSGTAIDTAADVDSDGVPDQCDNDNDGVIDGQFFQTGFAPLTAANGNSIVTHMSCLVLDLDGRLNANAHGSIAQQIYMGSHSGWPADPTGGWTGMPLGSGYGPAEISGSTALASFNTARPTPGSDSPWLSLFLGAARAMQYAASDSTQRPGLPDGGCRLLPLSLPALEGRYGGQARTAAPAANATMTSLAASGAMPGVSGSNDWISTFNEQQFVNAGSPIDLQGRMKTRTIPAVPPAVVPTLSFAKPDASDEYEDDPYEVILGQVKGGGLLAYPRTVGLSVGAAPDNTFSVAELERVLRPYDADSTSLPPRLLALLGSQAEIGRLTFTTESWDIPVVTGTAADRLYGTGAWLTLVNPAKAFSTMGPKTTTSSTIPDGLVPPDLAAGLRLDLTRTGTTDLQRRALFKDLYLSCVALLTAPGNDPSAVLAEQYAQWAANVVEYQDPDSVMTQYEYDTNPQNGWDVDGDPATDSEPGRAVVWGAERPDVVITQTLAWTDGTRNGELYVMLHRPWNSRLEISGAAAVVAEPSDKALRSKPTVSGSFIALSGTNPAGEPLWRMQIVGATTAKIRFDQLPDGSKDLGSTSPPPTDLSQFGPDSWLCVRPSGASTENVVVPGNVKSFAVTNGRLKAPIGTTAIRLERLADPNRAYDAKTNPYLVVDAADVNVVVRIPTSPPPHQVLTRDQGWKQHFSSKPFPSNPSLSAEWGGSPGWLMWPNRPLVSVTELMHVPGFAVNSFKPRDSAATSSPGDGMLANYSVPSGMAYLPDPLLLEALRVPSRFAGTRATIPNTAANAPYLTALEQIGLYAPIVSVNQIDLGREPGRVNLNTISGSDVWNAVVKGPFSSSAAIPERDTANFVAVQSASAVSPAQPARSTLDLLALSSAAGAKNPFQDTPADISDAADNPLHQMHTATRLANTTTNRSHLFAVWVTLRTMEQTSATQPVVDQDTVRYHRMFFIYDRSKPVAFEPGKTHNVHNGILVKRVLQ